MDAEPLSLIPAVPDDIEAIALLHAASWRHAYRGMLPDSFLDGDVIAERRAAWSKRLAEPSPERRLVLKAVSRNELAGFACVLLDAEPSWGARLDNLHVKPDLKGRGFGYELFKAARAWVASVAPESSMHLWVIEANKIARHFYDRQGGMIVERATREVAPGLALPELRYIWLP